MLFSIKNYVSCQHYDNFVYILNQRTNEKTILRDISFELWHYITSSYSIGEIENILLNKYDVSKEILHCDIIAFIEELKFKDIIDERV